MSINFTYKLKDGSWQTPASVDSLEEAKELIEFHSQGRGGLIAIDIANLGYKFMHILYIVISIYLYIN